MHRKPNLEGICGVGSRSIACVVLALTQASCEAPQGEVGIYISTAGAGDGSVAPDDLTLTMIVRDFKAYDANDPSTNPDFHNIESDRDIVAQKLGSDAKPVYQVHAYPLPTFGKTYFDQWYRDVPGTNVSVAYPLPLTPVSDGQYEYDCRKTGTVDTSTGVTRRVFLPVDDGTPYATAFGNQGNPHNYAFTGELHARFTYPGQGSFRVRADDDLYVFIAGDLAINLGGIHGANGLELDVSGLGLVAGDEYPLDLFYAERAGKTGDLLISTSLVLRPAEIK